MRTIWYLSGIDYPPAIILTGCQPPLTPMAEDDVPVVLQALRQASSSNIKMLPHLLTRLEVRCSSLTGRNPGLIATHVDLALTADHRSGCTEERYAIPRIQFDAFAS